MNNLSRPTTPKERGQGMVEFALIASLFIMILLVVFDFGRAIYIYSSVHNAAREGARYGIIHPGDTAGISTAALRLTTGLDAAQVTVTPSFPSSDTIQVTVSYTFHTVTPLLGLLTGGPGGINLSSSAEMLIEN